ncbi:hypothetical protein MKX03_028721 [Papaver bracteatum]|nr:hypothetical protein MKX03_028721 [Papaver bracteatum]
MILLVYLLYPFHGQINGCVESTAGVLGVGRSEIGASLDDSTVTEQINGRSGGGASRKKRRGGELASLSEDESNLFIPANDFDGKLPKVSESRNGGSKTEGEESSGFGNKPAESTQNYVHVQARMGQATDSHSLAERIKYLSSLYMQFWQLIKKRKYELEKKRLVRMKILQDLVPGCNKVIGKALVLDEIINYIQSLQRQVEFLSMKLEAVNSRVAPSNDGYPARDASQSMAIVFLMPFWLQLMAGE